MNTWYWLLPLAILLTLGCKREAPPVRPEIVSPTTPTESPDVSVPDLDVTDAGSARMWRFPRLAQRGPRLQMARSEDGVSLLVGVGRIELGDPVLGDCVQELPVPAVPDSLPASKDHSRAVWATLRGGRDEAALRLTTTEATLIVDDGCTRTADLTAQLLGQSPDAEDPVYAPDGLVEDAATTNSELQWDNGLVRLGDTRLFRLSGLNATPTVEAWDDSGRTFGRVTLLVEEEKGEAVAGREHVIWARIDAERKHDVIVRSDLRFGADGPDQADTHQDVKWSAPHVDAIVAVEAQRTTRADALNVGAGRCPEMEGAIIFEHVEEVVTWALEDRDAKRVPLGRATRTATFASGCPDVATEELRKRKKRLFDTVPNDPVKIEAPETTHE